jgi:large subunit ribosomal protein L31
MKKNIHPKYHNKAKVVCACGNSFETGSTMEEIKTELCSACHPFYTGKQKLVDSSGRVEKFESKLKSKSSKIVSKKSKKEALAKKRAKKPVKMEKIEKKENKK